MNKLFTIIKREYLSKVCKKSFFILTVLGPILLTLLMVLPVIIKENSSTRYTILVVDNTKRTIIGNDTIAFFDHKFVSNEKIQFYYGTDVALAQKELSENKYNGVLEIANTNDVPHVKTFLYYADNEPSIEAKEDIQSQCKQILKNSILRVNYSMSNEDIRTINDPQIGFYAKDIRTGEDSYSEIKMVLGMILGFVIYFFIFFFGGQIMRSVSEEKTSRIVEVLVSSVKSIYLLFGKIIAVALVGLTQLGLWIVLTLLFIGVVKVAKPDVFTSNTQQEITLNDRVVTAEQINTLDMQSSMTDNVIQSLHAINFPLVIFMFIVYFLLGYLLYGALFGAVGSLIDNDSDAGQFSLPVTVPLLFAVICLPMVMQDPSNSLSFWLSIIPFTSPMIMLVRIPYGVAIWQIAISISLLILTIIVCMLISAKIYRTGILTYGKQITYKDLIKWLKRKNS